MDVAQIFDLVARKVKYKAPKKKSKIKPGVIAAIIIIIVVVIIIACLVLFFVMRSKKKKAALGAGKLEDGQQHNLEQGTPMTAPPGGNTSYQPLQAQQGQQQPQGYPQQSYPMASAPGYDSGYPPPGQQATGQTGAASDYYRRE